MNLYGATGSSPSFLHYKKTDKMKHEFNITGMTCAHCQTTVQGLLRRVPGVTNVIVTRNPPQAVIEMEKHIDTATLQAALKDHPQYKLSEKPSYTMHHPEPDEDPGSIWQTYKPIMLIFAFILGVTVLVELNAEEIDLMRWMRYFMAGFFLVFSFFKLLDLQGFASSYMTYDIIAKKWFGWGYVYPFVELALGVFFLLNWMPIATNTATFVVMGISTIGVMQSLMARRTIRCACLGAVFNLPMSTITLVEDLLMVGMSAVMLSQYLLAGVHA